MIQLNLDPHREDFIDIIKRNKNEKIIIFDLRDPINLYPYTNNDLRGWKDYLYKIFTILPEEYYNNLHFLSISYNFQECYKLVKNSCINNKLIHKNHSDFHIHFFPWLFSDTLFHTEPEVELSETINLTKKYKICMLSMKKKLARMLILSHFHYDDYFVYSNIGLDCFEKLDLLDETQKPIDEVNFYDKKLDLFYNLDTDVQNFNFKNSDFNIQKTERLTEDFNFLREYHRSSTNESYCFDQSILCNYAPLEYFESCIILNCEASCLQSSTVTEKTFKNFLFKKPYITMAGPYFNRFLKENQFELYDELFDYSYDNMNCFDRLNDLILQVSCLLDENIDYLEDIINSNDVKNKMNHNYKLSKDLSKLCLEYVKKDKSTSETLTELCCKMILDNHENFKPSYFS